MNIRKERYLLRLSTRELARESGVASSTISRLENGEPTYLSTARRVMDAIKRLKLEPAADIPGTDSITPKMTFGRARRRPDFARARKLLHMSQYALAVEFRVTIHEISKIESGYSQADTALEMQVETFLRVRLEEKGMSWPSAEPFERSTPSSEKITINFKDKPSIQVEGVKMWNPGPTTESAVDYVKMLDEMTQKKPAPCSACSGSGIVWNPNTGQPFKCPLCGA